MKKITIIASTLLAALAFASCGESYIEIQRKQYSGRYKNEYINERFRFFRDILKKIFVRYKYDIVTLS